MWAGNGQYIGLFQMGSHERERFARGLNYTYSRWAQVIAAHRYFMYALNVDGYAWGPWSCKPY